MSNAVAKLPGLLQLIVWGTELCCQLQTADFKAVLKNQPRDRDEVEIYCTYSDRNCQKP